MKKTINISNELDQRIKDYSKNQSITQSQTIEIACRAYFKLYEATLKLKDSFKDLPTMKDSDQLD